MRSTARRHASPQPRRSLTASLLGIALFAQTSTAWPQIYQCTESGRTRYQDRPCAAAPAAVPAAPSYRSPARVAPSPDFTAAPAADIAQAEREAEEARARLRSLDRTQRMRAQIYEIQRERAMRDHELRMRDMRAEYRERHEQRMATLKAIEERERARQQAEADRPKVSRRYLTPQHPAYRHNSYAQPKRP